MELTINFKVSCQLLGAILSWHFLRGKFKSRLGVISIRLFFIQSCRKCEKICFRCTTFVAEGPGFFSSHQTEVIIHYRRMYRDRIRSVNASLVPNRVSNSNNIQKAMWDTINKNISGKTANNFKTFQCWKRWWSHFGFQKNTPTLDASFHFISSLSLSIDQKVTHQLYFLALAWRLICLDFSSENWN